MKVNLAILLCLYISTTSAQLLVDKELYTQADTLRGSLRKERNYNVLKYHLNIRLSPEKRFINGCNKVTFIPNEKLETIQIDLFSNLKIDSIVYSNKYLKYERKYNAVFISFLQPLEKDSRETLKFYYSGHPIVAKNAPWDGGLVFSKDKNGKHWIATACQGLGASVWWPNKDHQSDEPDEGIDIQVEIPNGLMNVSNGRFKGKEDLNDGYTRWNWKVKSPINNYDVSLNIGDYTHFSSHYKDLDLDYYVLSYNLDKAKKQFKEVKPMMDCFYEKFGEYPFKEDGYKLVETPFLGMEHQSAVAYGNNYQMGYKGGDLSRTDVGLKWDYIIIHESGHEWFGNSITSKDIADMWIHESFTTYSEAVYIECRWGYEQSQKYINGATLTMISNDRSIIGDYGVNKEGGKDMYYKGAIMLNTIRHIINDDTLWWKLIRDYTEYFRHKIIVTDDVIDFFSKYSNINLKPIFKQYLYHTSIPVLEFKNQGKRLYIRWKTDVKGFEMPVELIIKGSKKRLTPTNNWEKLPIGIKNLKDIQLNRQKFYIEVSK